MISPVLLNICSPISAHILMNMMKLDGGERSPTDTHRGPHRPMSMLEQTRKSIPNTWTGTTFESIDLIS